jgi:hypothetical protein
MTLKIRSIASSVRPTTQSAALLAASLLVLACGSSSSPSEIADPLDQIVEPPDLSVALFDPDHLIEVQVEIDDEEWDLIRAEGRALPDVFSGCGRDYDYTYYSA